MKEENNHIQTGEIVLYQPDNSIRIDVRLESETVWLNRQQMATLFDRDVKTIGKHVNNVAFKDFLNGCNFALSKYKGCISEQDRRRRKFPLSLYRTVRNLTAENSAVQSMYYKLLKSDC
jgi:hypothetical protein